MKEVPIGKIIPTRGIEHPEQLQRATEELRHLIQILDFKKDAVLLQFLHQKQNGEEVHAITLPSGHLLLTEGHYRLIALVRAIQNGEIPHSWLETIRVITRPVTTPMPEALLLRLFSNRTWDTLASDTL